MGQVQNDLLYIIYKSSSQKKTKQRSANSLQITSICYFNAKSALLVLLTFIKVEKTKHEIFHFLILLLTICAHANKHVTAPGNMQVLMQSLFCSTFIASFELSNFSLEFTSANFHSTRRQLHLIDTELNIVMRMCNHDIMNKTISLGESDRIFFCFLPILGNHTF